MITVFRGPYYFLSTFYPLESPFVDDYLGVVIRYPTVEHAFQANKTLNLQERWAISKIPYPGKAKRAGRHVTLRKDWESIKVKVMLSLLRRKFDKDLYPSLCMKLLATGKQDLVHGNNWGDNFWGAEIIYNGQQAHPSWVGENTLGRLLMEVRADLVKKLLKEESDHGE